MSASPRSARINPRHLQDGTLEIGLSGAWTRGVTLPAAESVLETPLAGVRRVCFAAQEIEDWDSRLPVFLIKLLDHYRLSRVEVDLSGLPEGVQGLLRLAYAVPERTGARRRELRTPIVAQIGRAVLIRWQDLANLVRFVGEITLASLALARGRARFRGVDVAVCVQDAGPAALAIVTLISFLVGLILAFVGAIQLSLFGAQVYIANAVSLGMVREMGALMTAILMAGRTGAAYAAQLGTMNVNGEIDALRTMGISPVEFLVLPRMVALILMVPLLGVYADFMGILGGALVTTTLFDVPLIQFLNGAVRAVSLADLGIGTAKCFVFGVLIATAGCMRGMQAGRSASAVGDAATAAVVDSIVYIVVADSVITLICNRLGI